MNEAIQFHHDHEEADLDGAETAEVLRALCGWRRILRQTGLIGRRPDRYEGYAYGNLSRRAGDPAAGSFIITGTQTSGLVELTTADLARVLTSDVAANRVRSRGLSHPSSETLTHAAVYGADPDAGVVLHVHSPEIWRRAAELALPSTDPAATCGTPRLALEVERVVSETRGAPGGVLVMGGHPDGVIAWGRDADRAGSRLLRSLAGAYPRTGPPSRRDS